MDDDAETITGRHPIYFFIFYFFWSAWVFNKKPLNNEALGIHACRMKIDHDRPCGCAHPVSYTPEGYEQVSGIDSI